MSLEARILADCVDVLMRANSKKRPKPYPRPWEQDTGETKSKPPTVDQATILKALEARGYKQ